jgi:alpha-L-fucosidase
MGDYGTSEQYVPSSGGDSFFEACMTMNGTWGYVKYDHNWKSTETVIHNIVDVASKGGNYLLNVGPTAEGLIPEASVRILQETGKWMHKYSESIYKTHGSPLGTLPYGRCTAGEDKLYIHIFEWPDSGRITIPGIKSRIKKGYMLADPQKKSLPLEHINNTDAVLDISSVNSSSEFLNLIDTVVAIEYEGKLETDKTSLLFERDYKTFFRSADASINGATLKYEFNDVWTHERDYITRNWSDINDSMNWDFRAFDGGEFDIEINYASPAECKENEFKIIIDNTDISGKVNETGGWFEFKTFSLGKITLTSAGKHKISIKPVSVSNSSLMNLKSIILKPLDY